MLVAALVTAPVFLFGLVMPLVGASFGLRFTLPEDLKSLYLQFGIDLAEGNGEDSWTLCLHGRYIIDGKGLVRYAQTDPDYTRRPEPEETLDALLKLSV